jgi:hypothetical protein
VPNPGTLRPEGRAGAIHWQLPLARVIDESRVAEAVVYLAYAFGNRCSAGRSEKMAASSNGTC